MKLPQALSVVKIFNTPLLTLLLTDVLFFTVPLPPKKKKKEKQRFLGQRNFVESLGQEWVNASESIVWNSSLGKAGS